MADNGRQLMVLVPGGDGYIIDETAVPVFQQITDPDFIVSDSVVFKDTFFVFSASNGLVFFHSELNDPFSFGALDFGTSEINPDLLILLTDLGLYAADHRQLACGRSVDCSGFKRWIAAHPL